MRGRKQPPSSATSSAPDNPRPMGLGARRGAGFDNNALDAVYNLHNTSSFVPISVQGLHINPCS